MAATLGALGVLVGAVAIILWADPFRRLHYGIADALLTLACCALAGTAAAFALAYLLVRLGTWAGLA